MDSFRDAGMIPGIFIFSASGIGKEDGGAAAEQLNKIGPAQLSGWQNTARKTVLLL